MKTINKLAAVGYDKGGAPIALVVDDNGFDLGKQLGEIRRYELVPTVITDSVKSDATDGTILWRTDPNGVGCLWANGEFFVPPGDHDCDGFTGTQECDEDWYDFKGELTNQVCAVADPTHGTACVIGYQAGCADGSTTGACDAEICVGDALCADPNCHGDPAACLATHADMLPQIDCTIPIMTTATNQFFGVCPGQGNTFGIPAGAAIEARVWRRGVSGRRCLDREYRCESVLDVIRNGPRGERAARLARDAARCARARGWQLADRGAADFREVRQHHWRLQ